jgi:hypothetical protein
MKKNRRAAWFVVISGMIRPACESVLVDLAVGAGQDDHIALESFSTPRRSHGIIHLGLPHSTPLR